MSFLNYVQFIGANAFDVFQKELAQKLIYITNKAIKENKTQLITYSVAPEDLLSKEVPLKDTLWYEGRTIPLTLEDTQEKIAMWITRDITEKVLLERKIKSLLERDYLTGIYNRRIFLMRLSECFSEYQRYGNEVSLLMIDFDKFKYWNDKLGHSGGDKIICHVTELCTHILRAYDVFGRIGGEEFAVILPRTTVEQSDELAERLRQTVKTTPCLINGEAANVTISIGISQFEPTDESKSDILFRSDKAMYKSKQLGRNQVTQYSSSNCADITD